MRNLEAVGIVGALGCVIPGPASQGGGTTDAGTTSVGTHSISTMPIDPLDTTSSSSSGSESSDGGRGFLSDVDPVPRCDLLANDCAPGEVCRPSCYGDSTCVPLEREPDLVGEACTIDPETCIDTCEPWALCLYGTCRRYCDGQENNPVCDDADEPCLFVGERYPLLCVPECDALAQDCADGLGCWWVVDRFLCAPHVDEGADGYGDPCQYINTCAPGFHCVASARVPACAMGGCCTPYCEVDDADPCPGEGQICARLFEGHEEIGLCVVPD